MIRYLFLLFSSVVMAQGTFHDARFGFSMMHPTNWFQPEIGDQLKNASERIKLSPEKLEAIFRSHQNSIEIVTFLKHHPDSIEGIIPTIKVILRPNPTKTLDEFKTMIEYSINSMKKTFPDFVLTQPVSIVKLNGKSCVLVEGLNKIVTRFGTGEVRTVMYTIPDGDTFYQINFMDTPKENCNPLFIAVANSIRW